MPKKTFFGLPQEKQQRLLEAAKVEFSRTSLQEASVANIVKLAEIPRGSFYQYFEDKEDLYYYYFDSVRRNSKVELEKAIKEADGDLFAGFEQYFLKMIREILIGPNASFYRNLFMNMDYRASNRVSPGFDSEAMKRKRLEKKEKHHKMQSEEFLKMVDISILQVDSAHELSLLIQMLMATIFSTITSGYHALDLDENYDIDNTIRDFRLKLEWLKYGSYRKKGTTC